MVEQLPLKETVVGSSPTRGTGNILRCKKFLMTEFFQEHRTIIVLAHALSGAIGVGATIVTDALFMQFLADFKISRVESNTMRAVSTVFWVALGIILVTGIMLYLTDTAKYSTSSKFLIKMVAVGVIILNGLVLNWFLTPRLKHMSFHTPTARIKNTWVKRIGFACGSISLLSWVIAFLLGSSVSIPLAFSEALIIYFCLLGIGIACSQIGYRLMMIRSAQK